MAGFTLTNVMSGQMGDRRIVFCRATGDGTAYTSGGDTLTPAMFGLNNIDFIFCTTTDTTLANLGTIGGATSETWKLLQTVLSTNAQFSGNNTFIFDLMVVGY